MTNERYGELSDGTAVTIYAFTNQHGLEARILDYGGILTSLTAPDRDGRPADVVLGCRTLDDYVHRSPHFGSIVGRYSNRIANGRFALDGQTYQLARNNGANHLHGGVLGFDRVIWHAQPFSESEARGLVLSRVSPDGEEGYPGRVAVSVRYALTDDNTLDVQDEATTDKATPLNLTQHSYFNLAGEGRGDILGHRVWINASRYVPVAETLIPTGVLAPVAGTPFDFTEEHPIGRDINAPDTQLGYGEGYDHTYAINRSSPGLAIAARAVEPLSGRALEVSTSEPGLHFYTGNHLDGRVMGPSGVVYERRAGFCFEAQHFPDSPNHPEFPSTILRPGETYRSRTVFAFGIDR